MPSSARDSLMNLLIASFLVLPVIALIAKELGKLKLSRWSIFLIYVAVGWMLIYFAVERYFASLDEIVRNTPNPSEELLDRWQNDGAKRVFALYFGWFYAAIYFLGCSLAIYIVRLLKRPR